MFWIEKYRPRTLSDIVHHTRVCSLLAACASTRTFPHFILTGPHGTGKSAAIEAALCQMYHVSTIHEAADVTVIQTADLMDGKKAYFEKDERFTQMFRKDESFLSNVKHIINWYAGVRPIDADFRVIVFEDAHTLSHDIQHALRRIMERYSETCRFVFCTVNTSIFIPPILSRCVPLYFEPIPEKCIISELRKILAIEQPEYEISEENIHLLAKAANGDLRKAIMYAQVLVTTKGDMTPDNVTRDQISLLSHAMFKATMEHDRTGAQERLLELMAEHGLSAREVLNELLYAVRSVYNHPEIVEHIARTDMALTQAANEYVQMNALLSDLSCWSPRV